MAYSAGGHSELKKVIALAAVIAATLLFAIFYRLEIIGILDRSAYALTDNEITRNLLKDGVVPEKASVRPEKLDIMAPLYERGGYIYAGERKSKLNAAYPLFVNGSTALFNINDSVKLITADFQYLGSYYGLYVSEGVSFNADGERADAEEFILLGLSNKMHINAKPMEVHTICDNVQISMNSVINFREETICYYSLQDGQFQYGRIMNMDEQSYVCFGDTKYPYFEFLKKLGKLYDDTFRDEIKGSVPPVREEIPPEPETAMGPERRQKAEPPIPFLDDDKQESHVNTKAPRYRKPQVSMSDFGIDYEGGSAGTTLTIYDPLGKLTGEIRVMVSGQNETSYVWTFADYAGAREGALYTEAVFAGLEKGGKYTAEGMFTYLDAAGQVQNEIFGPITFLMAQDYYYYDQKITYSEYKKPVISCGPFTAGIYELKSNLIVQEHGSLIGDGVRFEVYRGERLYMRKTVSEPGEFKIGLLPPGTEYRVSGSFTYLNEYNMKVEEKLLEQTISTLPLTELAPMTLSFANGRIFHDKIQLIEMSFADDPADGAKKAGYGTVPYVAKITVGIDNNAYSLTADQVGVMKSGGEATYETPAVLQSDTEYHYDLWCCDRFGNELPLTEPAKGETHTCKAPPQAVIRLTGNEVANTELTVQIENTDHVPMQNCGISLFDIDGNLTPAIVKTEKGGFSAPSTLQALPDHGGKIVFANLAAGEAYTAVVYCDYDLNNGEGVQTNKEIGHTRFTTLPISALGNAVFSTVISGLTDSGALLSISLDKNRTNQSLVFLLDKVTAAVIAPDGEEVTSVSLTGEELQGLKDGEPLEIQAEYLLPVTEYKILITAEVEQGSVIYNIKTANRPETFKTLRKEPQVVIPAYFVTSNCIELFDVQIDDPDGAIISKVNLLVTNSFGKVAGMSILQANTLYERLSFPKLVEKETYTFTFIAAEYNNGYDYSTYRSLYQLKPVYQIINQDRLLGKIELQSLNEIGGDAGHFSAKLRVQITDEKKVLADDPQYLIKAFRDGEAVETFKRVIDPADSDVDATFFYQVEARCDYRLELWVDVRGHQLKLDETIFNTEQKIIGLSNIQDFEQLRTNPTGRYIVLNNIDLTAGPFNDENNPFNGELDFRGHTLTSTKGNYLFYRMGQNGVLKNMVLDLTVPYNDPLRHRGFIAYRSSGHMQNIVVNLKGCTEYLHNLWGVFCYQNYYTGVIENFVVNLENTLYARTNFGCVAYYNDGVIRDGYVYGADIILPDIYVEEGYTATNFGGIVGVNSTRGRVESVFALVNIRTGAIVTPSKNCFGMIAGVNNGILKGAFTTGEVYFEETPDYRYGPAVGSQGGKLQTSACYISSETSIYQNSYNTKVTKETLYDPLWHHAVLGGAFEIDEPVLLGYYPQLQMPDCMPAQAYIPLPELDVANAVDLISVMVEEQHEDYAVAVFTFENPNGYTIREVGVEYLQATVIAESQVDKDELSRVRVRLENPTYFFSNYSVMYIGYRIFSSGTNIIRTYQQGEHLVNAEFFKPVYTVEDWTSIQDKMEQNYRLKEDLDFNNVPQAAIRIGKTDGSQFTGKLDGGIYDENERLTGWHTIRNIDLSGGLGGVISNLKGSVSNLRVEQLILESPADAYVGFVRRTQSGALIDNIHIGVMRGQGSNMAGGIVGLCNYATVQNCSVNRLTLKDATAVNVALGGIAGQTTYSTVSNCYVYGLDMRTAKAKTGTGAGGLIGYVNNSEVRDCYAVGMIRTTTQNAGGLFGRVTTGCVLENMWSDVDIVTDVDYTGGMMGFYGGDGGGLVPVNTLVLGDLYCSVATAANVRRIIGNSDGMFNAYAWSGQLINGEVPYEQDGVTIAGDGAVILSDEQLRLLHTYTKYIKMGGFFDYSKVSNGTLPQLYSTEGILLPYQTDHMAEEDPKVEITDITAQTIGNSHMIQIKLTHKTGVTIENAVFDYLNVNTQVIPAGDGATSLICTVEGAPLRYLDSYQINGIMYNSGKIYSVLAQFSFEIPFYLDIPDVATWQSVMSERKNNYENFRITGNLDFGNRPDIVYDVNINRLVGSAGQDGQYTSVKNISIAFAQTGQGFINTANAGLNNLQFENISLTNLKAGGSAVGVIGKCLGDIEKVTFRNITIDGLSASQVGCIGYSAGNITNVGAEKVTVRTTADQAGGLVGRAQNSLLSKLSVKEANVSGKSYVGSLAGYVYGDLSYSTAENVTVTGTGNIAGGLAGYACAVITGDYVANQELTVKNSKVQGVSYVGGIFGQGQLRNSDADGTWSRVDNTLIIGTGGYVGGLAGSPTVWYNRNGEVRGCQIFGGYYVGGAMGSVSQMMKVSVLDSVISTIYDPKYTALTGQVVEPTSATQNIYIGGIAGFAGTGGQASLGCGVVNCAIGAEGADHVGGISGYIGSGGYNNFCLDSTVYGRNNIGGIGGYHRMGAVYACCSNAEVIASGVNAGGLAGYMYINRVLDGTSIPRLVGNYYVGNVSAADYAGGLAGRASAELSGDNSRLLVAANVTSGGSNGDIAANLAGGSFAYLRIYDNSVLYKESAPGMTAAHIYASEPQTSAGMMLVTSAQLKTRSTYTNLGSYFGTAYKNYTSLDHNFMPYLTYRVLGSTATNTMPYQEGKDENGVYNPVGSYLGGIPIPTGQTYSRLMGFIATPGLPEPAAPDFYASGADKLNIEFNAANERAFFTVAANGLELFSQKIAERVYTLNYDFVTPLVVTVTDGFHKKQYGVDPALLRRDVLTWDREYYYITDLGVQSGKSGLLAGNFIHLWGGQGLTASGKLCDLTDGGMINELADIALCQQAQPLYSFGYEDYRIKTYQNFSESTRDGQTVTRELQLLVKNGRLSALDPALPIIHDAVIVDSAGGGEYMTVLGADGMLADMKEPVCLPADFKNRDIAQMSNTIHSVVPYALVRYQNGSVVAFNYLNGEVLSVETVKSDMSLLAYAKNFFITKLGSVLSDFSEGYLQITRLEKELAVYTYPDDLESRKETIDEATANEGATDEKTTDEETDEETDDKEAADGEAGENTAPTSQEPASPAADGDTEKYSAKKSGGTESPGKTEPAGIKETKAAQPETETKAAQPETEKGIVKPKPQIHKYIPVYDSKTGKYLLYDEKKMLEAQKENFAPVNEQVKSAAVMMEEHRNVLRIQENLRKDNGIILLFLIAIAIITLLAYIYNKRRRI